MVSKQNAKAHTAITTVVKKYPLVIICGLSKVSSIIKAATVKMAKNRYLGT